MNPIVSFVVPCYKLSHLLAECVTSILAQTYGDFEVLIMDDCSPDDTPQVALSFGDSRVRHIRNETNLGHLRNYNKGISLARGKYVWLISADDRLRCNYVLKKYVELLDRNQNLGYVFCPGVAIRAGLEAELIADFLWGDRDRIFRGSEFLSILLPRKGGILAPAVMARKDCYEEVTEFPVDMPHQADLYIWCIWALKYDVGYFAEPMVSYRLHDLSMMSSLKRTNPRAIIGDQIAVQWRVKYKAEAAGCSTAVHTWMSTVAHLYAYCLVSERFKTSPYTMTIEGLEESLHLYASSEHEKRRVRARVYASYADGCHRNGDRTEAANFYYKGLKEQCWMPKVFLKLILISTGPFGLYIRKNWRAMAVFKAMRRMRPAGRFA